MDTLIFLFKVGGYIQKAYKHFHHTRIKMFA